MICLINRLYPVDKTRVNEYGQSFDEDSTSPGIDGKKQIENKKNK